LSAEFSHRVQLKTEPRDTADLTALPVYAYNVRVYVCNLPYIRVGVGYELVQLSNMPDFEGTANTGKPYSEFPTDSFHIFFLCLGI